LLVEPYQIQMQRFTAGASDTTEAILEALVAAGADAKRRDGWSRNTLWYCRSVADAARHVELGLDPTERGAGGETLLHGIINTYRTSFGRVASAVALFTYYRAIGLDINAADRDGATVLHVAAMWSNKTDIAWLLSLGADKTATDKRGRRPVDRALPRIRKCANCCGYDQCLNCCRFDTASRRHCRGNEASLRHCERSEAIQKATSKDWIASSQELLAMTASMLRLNSQSKGQQPFRPYSSFVVKPFALTSASSASALADWNSPSPAAR